MLIIIFHLDFVHPILRLGCNNPQFFSAAAQDPTSGEDTVLKRKPSFTVPFESSGIITRDLYHHADWEEDDLKLYLILFSTQNYINNHWKTKYYQKIACVYNLYLDLKLLDFLIVFLKRFYTTKLYIDPDLFYI